MENLNKIRTADFISGFNSNILFRLIFWCTVGFSIPISILFGLLALFDIVPATLNEKSYTGILGFLISIVMAPMLIAILACVQWFALAFGLKLIKIIFKLLYK